MRFDHERIPERVVHARGSGAHGFFESYGNHSNLTRAAFLQSAGKKTPVFVRFSTVVGSRGSADTVRDVRGFATKFYTEEGNFDLVGNNIPVFFIQDGIKFPDLVHSVKPEPHHEMPQASSAHDTFWDFISLTPESTHMIMWHLSDRAIPRSFANMQGFGVHTFRLVDAKGKSRFVKFHWKPLAGAYSLLWDEAQKIAGKDPDFHRKGLFESIEEGNFPEWELGVQIVEEKDEMKFDFDLLDPTKIIPEELVPITPLGKMILNKNPDNFFAETEQVAFCTANLVSGIDVSNDPLLQARMFSYMDTQLTRLGGPNFAEIPINRPIRPVVNHQQDGFMRQGILNSRVNYSPNSLGGNSPEMSTQKDGGFVHFPQKVDGQKRRERSPSFDDHYSQATLFLNSQSDVEKEHLIDAACFELGKVETLAVRARMIQNFMQVDQAFAMKVAAKVGVKAAPLKNGALKKITKSSKALSLFSMPGPDLKGRKIAVLLKDGFSMKEFRSLEKELMAKKARAIAVAPILGEIKSREGEKFMVPKTFDTADSVVFDGIYVLSVLDDEAKAIQIINEAYKHQKTIGFGADAIELVGSTLIDDDNAQEVLIGKNIVQNFVTALTEHRHWKRNAKIIPA